MKKEEEAKLEKIFLEFVNVSLIKKADCVFPMNFIGTFNHWKFKEGNIFRAAKYLEILLEPIDFNWSFKILELYDDVLEDHWGLVLYYSPHEFDENNTNHHANVPFRIGILNFKRNLGYSFVLPNIQEFRKYYQSQTEL